jgi:hypothetical protein
MGGQYHDHQGGASGLSRAAMIAVFPQILEPLVVLDDSKGGLRCVSIAEHDGALGRLFKSCFKAILLTNTPAKGVDPV